MSDRLTPLQVLLACFSIASLAGLAALLRSGRPMTWREVASSMLYSGIFGLTIGLLWYKYFGGSDNLYFLVGVSGLAGLGGTSLLDFVVQGISKGFNIKITSGDRDDDDSA